MITLEINTSTQYATAYRDEKPIATVQRKRTYEDGPTWRVYGLDGKLLFTTYFSRSLSQRIAKVVS